jgi:hypothetical protein
MSTAPTVLSGSSGSSRRPAASTPATRCDGSREIRVPDEAKPSSRSASEGGSRSAARGSRTGCDPMTCVSRLAE